MQPLDYREIIEYVEQHIGAFHQARLTSLQSLTLQGILKRKNPYLFRAKNILTAETLVKTLFDAHLSSQEETIFGNFLEGLAIFICGRVFGGRISTAVGVDLEFMHEKILYLVAIKSGPNWGNSSQIARMRDNFMTAKRVLATHRPPLHVVAVNGCCYGRDNNPQKADYLKYCGQQFWHFISGDATLFTDILEPLGHLARQRNDQFDESYAQVINRFSAVFIRDFASDGKIDWKKLVEFNSATLPAKIT